VEKNPHWLFCQLQIDRFELSVIFLLE
jgi:hypothetical protein